MEFARYTQQSTKTTSKCLVANFSILVWMAYAKDIGSSETKYIRSGDTVTLTGPHSTNIQDATWTYCCISGGEIVVFFNDTPGLEFPGIDRALVVYEPPGGIFSFTLKTFDGDTDAGNYSLELIASNKSTERVISSFQLILSVPPSVLLRVDGMEAGEAAWLADEAKNVTCQSFGGVPQGTVSLSRDGTELVTGTVRVSTTISLNRSSKRTIIRCAASNVAIDDPVVMEIAPQALYHPDVIVTIPSDVRAGDEAVTISCMAAGSPAEYNFGQWVQLGPDDKTPIRALNGIQNGSTFYHRFQNPVTYQDSGYYKCTVDNGVKDINGHLYQTHTKELAIEGSPYIFEEDGYEFGEHIGFPISLHVDFYSYPRYSQITWFAIYANGRDNVSVESNDMFEKRIENKMLLMEFHRAKVNVSGYVTILDIANVSKTDFRTYHVVIINEMGQSQTAVELREISEPDIPKQFGIEVITAISITVFWNSGDNGGVSNMFVIQYRQTSTNGTNQHWQEHNVIEIPGTLMYTEQITALKPAAKYDFRIYAKNNWGESHKTDTFIVKTEKLANPTPEGETLTCVVAGTVPGVLLIVAIISLCLLLRRTALAPSRELPLIKKESLHIYENQTFATGEDLSKDDMENVYQPIGPPENPNIHYQSLDSTTTTDRVETLRDNPYINL